MSCRDIAIIEHYTNDGRMERTIARFIISMENGLAVIWPTMEFGIASHVVGLNFRL